MATLLKYEKKIYSNCPISRDIQLQNFQGKHPSIMALYMSSSFWLLGVESRNFSHAEKERTACKNEQIHKMTTIFTHPRARKYQL